MSEQADGSGQAADATTVARETYCPKCGYQLTGLALRGECPECGEAYDPEHVAVRHAPTTLNIVTRFGWPLALYASTTALGLALLNHNDDVVIVLIYVAAFALAACVLNIPIQMWLIRRKYGKPIKGGTNRYVTWMIIMSVTSIIGAFVVFGGCLAFIM